MSIFVYLRHCAWGRLDFVGFSAMVSRERILSAITFGIEVTMAEKKTSSKQNVWHRKRSVNVSAPRRAQSPFANARVVDGGPDGGLGVLFETLHEHSRRQPACGTD